MCLCVCVCLCVCARTRACMSSVLRLRTYRALTHVPAVTRARALALLQAFEDFANADSRCAQNLSVFVDDLLRHGLKGVSEEETEARLDKVIVIFRFLQDKDVFENFYKKSLQRRLLTGNTLSDDAERMMVAKLKVCVGGGVCVCWGDALGVLVCCCLTCGRRRSAGTSSHPRWRVCSTTCASRASSTSCTRGSAGTRPARRCAHAPVTRSRSAVAAVDHVSLCPCAGAPRGPERRRDGPHDGLLAVAAVPRLRAASGGARLGAAL